MDRLRDDEVDDLVLALDETFRHAVKRNYGAGKVGDVVNGVEVGDGDVVNGVEVGDGDVVNGVEVGDAAGDVSFLELSRFVPVSRDFYCESQ